MIPINKAEETIYNAIKANPGATTIMLVEATRMKRSHIITTIVTLDRLGLIRKEGNNRNRTHYAIDLPTRCKEKGDTPVKPPEKPEKDELLESLAAFTFTPKQLEIVKANEHLQRRELAKLLGIPKLELNVAMERMGKR